MPSNADRLMEALAPVFGAGEIEFDDRMLDEMIELLRPLEGPELTGTLRAQSGELSFDGVDGLKAAWLDWMGVFTSVRLEPERFAAVGDNVLMLVTQTGTTRHGVEVVQPSAAVWKYRDGLIVRVEFHLDRDEAEASAREPA